MSAHSSSSLLLLYAGGTIGMRQDARTSALRPALTIEQLIEHAPLLNLEFNIETRTVTNLDSTNMQPHHWQEIAAIIAREYKHFDGFVVIHGTDTMAYTASALSFALGNLGKPVVMTGAQLPADMLGTDAISNMVNACQAATMDFAEVAIVFGTRILRGNRSTKISESERNAFISPNFPELGSIRLQPELLYPNITRRHSGALQLKNRFTGTVAVLKVVPGMSPIAIEAAIEKKADAIVLESFGPGNLPSKENDLRAPIKSANKKGIPVIVTTQCIYGTTRMYLYEVGTRTLELGIIPARDMTSEATYAKILWALAQTKDIKKVARIFNTNVAGEVTIGK